MYEIDFETETATEPEMEDEVRDYEACFISNFGAMTSTRLGQGSFAECHAWIRKCYNDTPAPPGSVWCIIKRDPRPKQPQHHHTGACSACGRKL